MGGIETAVRVSAITSRLGPLHYPSGVVVKVPAGPKANAPRKSISVSTAAEPVPATEIPPNHGLRFINR
jgi:hypothetical protein